MIDQAAEKEKACSLANALLQSHADYLDHVVELWRAGTAICGEAWNTEFHVFGVIASDTDHLSLKLVRPQCSTEMLKRADEELERVIDFYRHDVEAACREILSKHGGT